MRTKINDGGPAFPCSALLLHQIRRQLTRTIYADNKGMSLRDYFAARAMEALVRNGYEILSVASLAFAIADSMLAARKKKS